MARPVDCITYTAQPSRWGSGPAMYRICANARRNGIKVLLSGDCSDELLGGYQHYEKQFDRADQEDFGPLVSLNQASPHYRASDAAGFVARERALRAEIEAAYGDVPDPAERYAMISLCHDSTTFLQICGLPHADAYSMMTSVELRNPMLDLDLAAFALSLPMRYRAARHVSGQFGKVVLRELAELEIGSFLNRRKEGTRNYAMAVAKPEYWRFDAFAIRDVIGGFEPGSARDIIRLFNLELFHRICILGERDCLPRIMTDEGLKATEP